MKDKLDIIFQMQDMLNSEIRQKRSLEYTKEEWVQKLTLAMISELSELIDEVNFKWWKNPKKVDNQAVKEEMVDILHFFVSMCIAFDMDADEVFEIYKMKNKENFDRQYGKSSKKGYELSDL